jgi:hypothetical protein
MCECEAFRNVVIKPEPCLLQAICAEWAPATLTRSKDMQVWLAWMAFVDRLAGGLLRAHAERCCQMLMRVFERGR